MGPPTPNITINEVIRAVFREIPDGYKLPCDNVVCRREATLYTHHDDKGELPPVPTCASEVCAEGAWREARWIRQEYLEDLYPKKWRLPLSTT